MIIPAPDDQHSTEIAQPERRDASGKSVIAQAKTKVPTIDFADRLCGPGKMRRIGKHWVATCPLPGHQERTPSFKVNTERNTWRCYGACQSGGDVIDLAAAAWGYDEGETAMAAAEVLREFGHDMPPRPASWHRRQTRQERARRAIEAAKLRRVQRRIYRWILAPALANITDEDERLEEATHAWEDAAQIARLLVAQVAEVA